MKRTVPKNSAPIIHEILEKLAISNLSAYEYKILFAIFRKTYGWQKKEDWIAASQLSKLTNIPRPHVSRTLKKLLEKNIIYRNGKVIGINKDTASWKLPTQVTFSSGSIKKKLPIQVTEVTYTGNEKLPIQVHTKEKHKINYTKETSPNSKNSDEKINKKKKRKKEEFSKTSREYLLAFHLFEEIKKNDPGCKIPNFQNWAAEVDKMLRIDKRTPQQIDYLIHWTQQDNFWMSNILSPAKLREKFSRLALRIKGEYQKQAKKQKSFEEIKF